MTSPSTGKQITIKSTSAPFINVQMLYICLLPAGRSKRHLQMRRDNSPDDIDNLMYRNLSAMEDEPMMSLDLSKYKYFLIIDLEATCCNRQSLPVREMETIEIGAVMVDATTLETVDDFMTFIKPVRHPTLTAFCTELTSITQADVDTAPDYPEAVNAFKAWLYQYQQFLFCSWGDYDKHQLEQDSQYHRVPYPIGAEHLNIKKLFSANQNLKKKYGMANALELAGLPLDGTHHRGIDDARNMARLMPYILGRKAIRAVPESNS